MGDPLPCGEQLKVLSSSPHLLDLMDFSLHEASSSGNLLKSTREVLGSLMVIVSVVHLEIHLPYTLDEFGVLFEGLPLALLEEFHKGPSLFLPLVSFWRDV